MSKDTATIAEPSPQEAVLTEALAQYEQLLESQQSVIIGTVSSQGLPDASYAPAIRDEANNFYVYVSALARHTSALKSGRKASVMVIEDEASAGQLFARKRVTYVSRPVLIERETEEFNRRMDEMAEKLGGVVGHLRGMLDFELFRLEPDEGRLVTGFGRAFRLTGEGMRELHHLGGGSGHGHKMKRDA
ncbi:MAG: pyridoxamine 5'-phosphate oxidase family protein [Verrucomicrobiota bacterium JB022]|nr:pyridoxamine 5'-phosphate oxidase family protein [Verrucomicrobiota bacterium JB022]